MSPVEKLLVTENAKPFDREKPRLNYIDQNGVNHGVWPELSSGTNGRPGYVEARGVIVRISSKINDALDTVECFADPKVAKNLEEGNLKPKIS